MLLALRLLSSALPVASASDACLEATRVVSHTLAVTAQSTSSAQARERWEVELGDPASCTAGVPAPGSLDGARDGDAVVRGDRLWVPLRAAAGTTFVLERTHWLGEGPWSGLFTTPAGLEVSEAEVSLSVPGAATLSLWTDDHALVENIDPRRRRVAVRWRDAYRGPRTVGWSTWPSWSEVGERLTAAGDLRRTTRRTLGAPFAVEPAVTSDRSAHVDALVAEAAGRVRVVPGNHGGFGWARSPAEVVRSAEGTAAERALVLLVTLREAGFDARPGLVRPGSLAPLSGVLPAPELYPVPAVVVDLPTGRRWIDPAAPAATDALPAAWRGALAVVAGEPPTRLRDRIGPDGVVYIDTAVQLDRAGAAMITSTLRLRDGAAGALRDWLAPMTGGERAATLEQMVRRVRPDLERLSLVVTGIDDPTLAPGIDLLATEPAALPSVGDGLGGVLPAMLGPALAAALPGNIEVVETLTVAVPSGLVPLVTHADDTGIDGLWIHRDHRVAPGKVVLETRCLRPVRSLEPLVRVATVAALEASPAEASSVFLLPADARAADLQTVAEGDTSQALMLRALLDPVRSEKWLGKALGRLGLDKSLDLLHRFAQTPEPWRILVEALDDDRARLAVIEDLEHRGFDRDAWQMATALTRSADPSLAVSALVAVARLEGRQPDARKDKDGRKAWVEPVKLLRTARSRAEETLPDGMHPDLRVPLTVALTEVGKGGEAVGLLPSDSDDVQVRAADLLLRVSLGAAETGEPAALAADARGDAFALDLVARSAVRLGDPALGCAVGLEAARADAREEELWMRASEHCLLAGDLDTALYAARRASDLDPVSNDTGVILSLVASLAGDAEAARLATERVDYQALIDAIPAPFDKLLTITQPAHELAVLRRYDTEVLADPELLERRAALHFAAGFLGEAARDGGVLAERHRVEEGRARVHGATANRLWSLSPLSDLPPWSREPAVRAVRMTSGLVAGGADPQAEAGAIRDDPRGQLVRAAVSDPASLLGAVPPWPAGLADPSVAGPAGTARSRTLSGVDGVVAFTDEALGASMLYTSEAVGHLPPPLLGVWTMGPVVALDEDGTEVRRYDGPYSRLIVARRVAGAGEVFGVAFTQARARQALELALSAL